MLAKIRRYRTSKFTERAPLIALGAFALVLAGAIASPLFSLQLMDKRITVPVGGTVKLHPIQPSQRAIGAVQINVTAILPDNTWSTFEVKVFDERGNLLASAVQYASAEAAAATQIPEGRFNIRSSAVNSPLTIAISSLDRGTIDGQSSGEVLTLEVTAWEGAVNWQFLGAGLLGTLALAGLSAIAVTCRSRTAIYQSVKDSDPEGRGILGGADALVQVAIQVISDETSPKRLQAHLSIKNSDDRVVYRCRLPVPLTFRREGGRVDSARGRCSLNLILEPEASYSFCVEVVPDAPVDWTLLQVRQVYRTLQPQKVTHIQYSTPPQ